MNIPAVAQVGSYKLIVLPTQPHPGSVRMALFVGTMLLGAVDIDQQENVNIGLKEQHKRHLFPTDCKDLVISMLNQITSEMTHARGRIRI